MVSTNSEQNRLTVMRQRPIPIRLRMPGRALLKQRMDNLRKMGTKTTRHGIQSATISYDRGENFDLMQQNDSVSMTGIIFQLHVTLSILRNGAAAISAVKMVPCESKTTTIPKNDFTFSTCSVVKRPPYLSFLDPVQWVCHPPRM